jgi:hypothetical protein
MKKKQEVLTLPIFLDQNEKRTLEKFHTETVDGVSTQVENRPLCDQNDEQFFHSVNRKTKRYFAAQKRRKYVEPTKRSR